MKILKNIFISGLAVAASAISAQALPDIGGVKMGTQLATQKPLIEKINADYKFSEIKTREGKVVGIQGIAENNSHVSDHFIALQDDSGRIWFLGRAQKYPEGSYIPKATFLSALKQKYGIPSSVTPDEQTFLWAYDRNYALMDRKSSSGACPSTAGGNVTTSRTDLSRLKGDGISLAVPGGFESTCGIQLNANLNRHYNADMIVGSSIQMVDHKVRYDVLDKKNSEEEAARKKALDAMKDNKPKL